MNQKRPRILIVEDDPLICRSLETMLRRKGAEVLAVGTGREALESLKTQTFDRVLCDLMLQDFTGFDILEEIRPHWGEQRVRETFILMTAYSSGQVLEKVKKYGLPLLRKPFQDLWGVIDAVVTNKAFKAEMSS